MVKLFKKDLMLFFNDPKSFVLTFLLPVILITLFAFAYGAIGDPAKRSESITVLVVNHDSTDISENFLSDIDMVSGISVVDATNDTARELITKGNYASALLLGSGFRDSLYRGTDIPLEILYDKEKELETENIRSVIVRTLISYSGKIKSGEHFVQDKPVPGHDEINNISSRAGNFSFDSFSPEMTSIVGEKSNSDLDLIQAIAGTAILMLLFSMASVGTSILDEKENGTINRLLYSPINSQTILYSKMLFAFFIAVIQLSVMFLFSWIFLGLDITVNIEALVIMIIATAFSISSMGIFLASIAKSRQQAQSLSTLIILVMSAVGGSMIPLYFMPQIMSKVAMISINYWGIQGFYDIFWRGLPLSGVFPKIMILLGIGLLMTVLSIRLINRNILKLI